MALEWLVPSPTRPFCNRAQGTGEILAISTRGLFMGNRGRIHDDRGRLGKDRWQRIAWITCNMIGGGRHRVVMGSGYTHLFFLDEAVSIAAGHRPCAQCRREAYDRFRSAWASAFGVRPLAIDMDTRLHAERVDQSKGVQVRHLRDLDALPDGAFVFDPRTGHPALVLGSHLVPCGAEGYGKPVERPKALEAVTLTPACSVAVLAAGYRPQIHPDATSGASA